MMEKERELTLSPPFGFPPLISSVVTVMFAKLTLSFVDEGTGEVDHAWEAA